MKTLVTVLIFVLIVALAALVTIPQWGVKKPDKVLIGHLADVPNCWLYFGLEQDFFEKYKLQPKLIEFYSYDEAFDSLANGKIDCFFSFPWSFLLNKMSDTFNDFKVIASFYSTPDSPYGALIVPEKPVVKDIKKLRKKNIGVSTHTHSELHILLTMALEQEISKKNVRVEQVGKTEISDLFKNKEIAAALLYEPELMKIMETGKTVVLSEDPISTYLLNPYPLYAACISSGFLDEKSEAALNLRNTFEEAFDFGGLNESDMRNSLTNYMTLTTSQSLRLRLPSFEKYGAIDRETIQNFANLLTSESVLSDTVEVEGLFFEMFE